MRIVVTGAKGFVGSVLSLRASELGHEVLALDNNARGLNNIKQGVKFLRHDCMEGIGSALDKTGWDGVDAVFHLAAATGSLDKPLEELCRFNVGMTKVVYQDAVDFGAKAFVWPTTSLALAVPDSPYVESKERGRKWLLEADKENGIAVPMRFFNVAGSYKGMTELRKDEVHILPVMVDCFLKGETFIINGDDYDTCDGTPSRDFVNVLDVVEELLDLASLHARLGASACKERFHPEDGAIWLGTGCSTTVQEVVGIFRQYVGDLKVQQAGRRAFDCGALEICPKQRAQFEASRGMLVPPHISLRDELLELMRQAEHLDVLGPQKAA